MRLPAATVAALALAASAHSAPVPTVLGIQIGAPPTLPECPPNGSGWYNVIALKFDCLTPDEGDPNHRTLWLSDDTQAHAGFARVPITLTMDGDNVVGMLISTTGVESQNDAARALTAKFGKPTHFIIDRLQNRMGARFTGVRASWVRPDVVVYFDSTSDDLDNGEIDVQTPALARSDAAKQRVPSL